MKTCTRCLESKPKEDFRWANKAKGQRAPWCRSCFSKHEKEVWKNRPDTRKVKGEQGRARTRRNAMHVLAYLKEHTCADCPETDPVVMEFDHRNRDEKSADVSLLISSGASLDRLQAEIDKCDVVCANCHRRRTAVQMGWVVRFMDI